MHVWGITSISSLHVFIHVLSGFMLCPGLARIGLSFPSSGGEALARLFIYHADVTSWRERGKNRWSRGLAQPVLSLLYRYILCSVHCYHCYFYCYCLLCCCCSVVLNLSLSQPRGFVFHSLCEGGAAAAWSQTPAGAEPSHAIILPWQEVRIAAL